MIEIEKNLRAEAKKLLEEKTVDYVIGYENSGNKISPCFIYNPDDAEKLVWNSKCANNLSLYLLEAEGKGRVAVVAKGCDSRAIIELLKQNQIERDKIFIIGVSCGGVEDTAGAKYDKCKKCKYPNPLIYDVLLGEKKNGSEDDYSDINLIESLPIEKRREFWKKELQKCIKCYACRNICPLCFCESCALEDKKLVSRSDKFSDVWMFHMIRAMHLSGRCVGCGECERACPVNIPLRKLYRKIEKDVKELFDYEAGTSLDAVPPLVAFNADDGKEK